MYALIFFIFSMAVFLFLLFFWWSFLLDITRKQIWIKKKKQCSTKIQAFSEKQTRKKQIIDKTGHSLSGTDWPFLIRTQKSEQL